MQENILIKSIPMINLKTILWVLVIAIAVIAIGSVALSFIDAITPHMELYSDHLILAQTTDYTFDSYGDIFHDDMRCEYYVEDAFFDHNRCICEVYGNGFAYALEKELDDFLDEMLAPTLTCAAVAIVACILLYFWLKDHEMVVTDKRIYGTVSFGKRVVIPNDSITAIVYIPLMKGVGVLSPSGRISFMLIKNASDIFDVVNNILISRQVR